MRRTWRCTTSICGAKVTTHASTFVAAVGGRTGEGVAARGVLVAKGVSACERVEGLRGSESRATRHTGQETCATQNTSRRRQAADQAVGVLVLHFERVLADELAGDRVAGGRERAVLERA